MANLRKIWPIFVLLLRQKKICLILLLTTACVIPAQEITKLTAADGSCEVSFPSEFIHHEQVSTDSGHVHLETQTYYVETSESKFVLIYLDPSPLPRVDVNAEDVINSAIGGTLKRWKGRLLSESQLTINGNPAKATIMSAGENMIIDGRFVYVKPRIYELFVHHEKKVTPAFEQQFFDSFSLKTAAAPINADQQSTAEQYGAVVIQMLTRNEGVDFSPFVKRLMDAAKRNWDEKMPQAARMGTKGKVVLHLRIHKNGTLDAPVIETSSGEKTLDGAAAAAILASAPFEQFPANFKGPDVEFRAIFIYNVPPPKR